MNRRVSPQLQIVVLSAGYSSRLGRSKALVRVRGISLLRRTASVLAPLSRLTILVVSPPRSRRYRNELFGLPATLIVNPQRSKGLSSSVHCAIRRSQSAAGVLLLPVDLVGLQGRDVARLILVWRGARRQVIARDIDGAAGTPLILPKWMFQRALAVDGDLGLRDFVKRLPREQLRRVRMASAHPDIDTPQDLHLARHNLHHGTTSSHRQPG